MRKRLGVLSRPQGVPSQTDKSQVFSSRYSDTSLAANLTLSSISYLEINKADGFPAGDPPALPFDQRAHQERTNPFRLSPREITRGGRKSLLLAKYIATLRRKATSS